LVSKGMAALLQQFAEQETELRQLQARTEDFRQKFKIASDAVAIQASAEQPYWELKQQLEQRLDLQRLLTAKIDAAKLDAQMPRTLVQIIDTAEPGRAPVRPNKPLDIMIGAVAGGGLGLLAGAASALFSARFGGRGRKPVAAG